MPNLCEGVEEDLKNYFLAGSFLLCDGREFCTSEVHQLADVCNVSWYYLHSQDPTREWKTLRLQKAYFVIASRVSHEFPEIRETSQRCPSKKTSQSPLESIDRQAVHTTPVCPYSRTFTGN